MISSFITFTVVFYSLPLPGKIQQTTIWWYGCPFLFFYEKIGFEISLKLSPSLHEILFYDK